MFLFELLMEVVCPSLINGELGFYSRRCDDVFDEAPIPARLLPYISESEFQHVAETLNKAARKGISMTFFSIVCFTVILPFELGAIVVVSFTKDSPFWKPGTIAGVSVGAGVVFLSCLFSLIWFYLSRTRDGRAAFAAAKYELNLNYLHSRGLQISTFENRKRGVKMLVAHRVYRGSAPPASCATIEFSNAAKQFCDEANILLETSMNSDTYQAVVQHLNRLVAPFQPGWIPLISFSIPWLLSISCALIVVFLQLSKSLLIASYVGGIISSIAVLIFNGRRSITLWDRADEIAREVNEMYANNGLWTIRSSCPPNFFVRAVGASVKFHIDLVLSSTPQKEQSYQSSVNAMYQDRFTK